MDTLPALLLACRADPADTDARGVMRDRVLDEDGDTPAAAACLAMCCEVCKCPDTPAFVTRGEDLVWRTRDEIFALSDQEFYRLYHFAGWGREPGEAVLRFYRWGRWRLVCGVCRRAAIGQRALATRKRNREAAPNLLTGLG